MRFLVIGSGGREHAIVRALKLSPSVTEVHATPGSAGISQEALCHKVDLKDPKAVEQFVKRYHFDCVIVGPEQPLVDGLTDQLRALGINTFGPSQAAAQLEGSKVFAKELMNKAGVPTAAHVVVDNVAETLRAADKFTPPYVLKADGLCAGKGVVICQTLQDLKEAAEAFFEKKIFGQAGARALLEQYQEGYEISYLILTNGEVSETMPLSQDHKRLRDGDQGPNTGGMGVVGPVSLPPVLRDIIEKDIVQPTLKEINGSGLLYRGVLYIGLMITQQGPRVIEFNTRFGDPETQVIMPLHDGDWGFVFNQIARGELVPMKWKNLAVACVVQAAGGYPDNPEKGVEIKGDLGAQTSSSYFLHAGTAKSESGAWITNGGRVLNVMGLGSTIKEAVDAAYAQARMVNWPGMQMRKDIGARQLK